MPLNINQARDIIKQKLPDGEIQSYIEYKTWYIFQVFQPDPDEGQFDPFFSVDKNTGEFRDFSILHDGDPGEIGRLFTEAQRKS